MGTLNYIDNENYVMSGRYPNRNSRTATIQYELC